MEDELTHQTDMFRCAALGDAIEGIFYTDMTGAFPVQSLKGKQTFLLHMLMI